MALQPDANVTLDGVTEQGLSAYVRSLPEKPATTIRFFDRNEYYVVYESDAIFTAKEVFKSTSVVKSFGSGEKKLNYVVLSKMNFAGFLRDLLLIKLYRIEIYKSGSGSYKSSDWSLFIQASPGDVSQVEDVIYTEANDAGSSSIAAIRVTHEAGSLTVGVASAQADARRFQIAQFVDGDQFSNLEACLVQLRPKECLLCAPDGGCDVVKIRDVIERAGALLTDRKKSDFNSQDIIQDLTRLLRAKKDQPSLSSLPELDKTVAMNCVSAVIKFLGLLGDETQFGHWFLETFDLKQYMRLDASALVALNAFPEKQTSVISQTDAGDSLFGILNRCRTAGGSRLLDQWLRQPLLDRLKLEERHDIVEALVSDSGLRQTLYDDLLKRTPDFQKLSKKFLRKSAGLADCYRVYQGLGRLPLLLEALDQYEGDHKNVLQHSLCNPLKALLFDFAKYQEMVESTVDLKQVENHEFLIKPDFDEQLQALRVELDSLEKRINDQLPRAASDLGLDSAKSIKLESSSQLGYYLRVTRKEEKVLRGNRNYMTIDTNKNGVRFQNRELRDLNERYMSTKREYTEQQNSIVAEVVSIAAGYAEPLHLLCAVISRIDVYVALAQSACSAPVPFIRPKLRDTDDGVLELKQIRHPCVEAQPDIAFTPNDVHFLRDKQRFHIITGPNMGGKSTYIRSVGCAVLLAQIGSFVPCDSAEISLRDAILARVGACDYQMKGVSTFMAEMLETSAILRSATKDSLVIIDELGRGTSTYDGFGLAWSISHHIASQIDCMCLFATHFHELTALADEIPTVNNLHVTALTENDRLTLLYQVKAGICDESFGIHVAEIVNFPKDVLEDAKRNLAQLEDFQDPELRGSGEAAAKRRKTEKQEGQQMIDSFLCEVKKLPSDLSAKELLSKVSALKQELINSNNNAYVKSIVSSV